ncbi:N-acetylglucosamine kinase [Streptomyces coerulescens]|uniref:N-acetylglucosamine kinase n=1 Tax=Streptomyces coerulescens TaxID=29304 RepID=A0ABW0CZ50_STRCD
MGLDVGGTTTRVMVADLAGRIIGTAHGGGGNPIPHGEAVAVRHIAEALRHALADVDPARVGAGVMGLAGGPFADEVLGKVWQEAELSIVPRVLGDLELAYASGTGSPGGSVVLSGTGAVAGECRDFDLTRRADGHGWLLGDRGSGYWLGRAAVEMTLDAIDCAHGCRQTSHTSARSGSGPPGRIAGLAASVIEELVGDVPLGPHLVESICDAVYGDSPIRLARLAPLVLAAAAEDDPDACGLVDEAADHLLATLSTVRTAGSTLPVVLAGGILSPGSPVASAVRSRVAARWPGASISYAGSTAGAAAWLAARDLGLADEELRTRLTVL